MASLFDFSNKISLHTRAKEYDAALSYFKDNKSGFSEEQIRGNEYLISDMLSCLRHKRNFDAAFKFLDIYKVEINEATKERILTAYGWLLYSKYKAENDQESSDVVGVYDEDYFEDEEEEIADIFHFSKSDLLKRIEKAILLLRNFKSDFAYTVLSNLFSVVVKTEKKKPAPNWRLIDEFCDLFNPTEFSTNCRTIKVLRKGQEKEMELASDKENWYAYKSKALMKVGKYQECYEISKQGLELFEKLHYSNEAWFSRRIALSKKNLGNTEDTISELKKILHKKKEWFIQKELAELLLEAGQTKEAFSYAIQALNNFGDLEFKIDLLYLTGKILVAIEESDKAFKHFSLSKLIRQKQEWRVPQKLHDELKKFDRTEISLEQLTQLKNELKKYWSSFNQNVKVPQNNQKDSMKGMVKKILNHNEKGKNGFIAMGGIDYYFSINSDSPLMPHIKEGKFVEFKILPAKDGKKNELARIIKLAES